MASGDADTRQGRTCGIGQARAWIDLVQGHEQSGSPVTMP